METCCELCGMRASVLIPDVITVSIPTGHVTVPVRRCPCGQIYMDSHIVDFIMDKMKETANG